MKVHALALSLLTAAGSLAVATSWSSAAQASPSDTGCPSAYALLSVSELEASGPYKLPRQLDDGGNRDGYVCGKETEDHAATNFCGGPCPAQIYNFTENDRTPGH